MDGFAEHVLDPVDMRQLKPCFLEDKRTNETMKLVEDIQLDDIVVLISGYAVGLVDQR